eukprot:GILJ01015198.1.p1 GENE.GILJ01015198.1~~GILJ01015198.1.p1  ORF type:complete len:1337 (+),score=187.94 GILJ01015198.1:75-4085(+)
MVRRPPKVVPVGVPVGHTQSSKTPHDDAPVVKKSTCLPKMSRRIVKKATYAISVVENEDDAMYDPEIGFGTTNETADYHDVFVRDKDGRSGVHRAVLEGHVQFLNKLFESNDVPDTLPLLDTEDNYGNTPLLSACVRGEQRTIEVVKLLLSHGVRCNLANQRTGWTPLHWASYHGDLETAKLLLANGSDPTSIGREGWFAVDLAGVRNHPQTGLELLRYMCGLQDKQTSVSYMVERLPAAVIPAGKVTKAAKAETQTVCDVCLYWAAYWGHLELVQMLISRNANVAAARAILRYRTPLHAASLEGHEKVLSALLQAVAELPKSDALLNAFDVDGNSALHVASIHGHGRCVELLLQHHADHTLENGLGIMAKQYTQHEAVRQIYESKSMRAIGSRLPDYTIVVKKKRADRLDLMVDLLQSDALLDVRLAESIDPKLGFVLLSIDEDRLDQAAEELGILVKLSAGNRMMPFKARERHLFEPLNIRHKQEAIRKLVRRAVDLDHLVEERIIVDLFPLHGDGVDRIKSVWLTPCPHPLGFLSHYFQERPEQNFEPLSLINTYMGEKVAFYFAWLSFYTTWLLIPIGPGILLSVWQAVIWRVDNFLLPFWSAFIAIWSTVMVERWKRKQAELAYKWGLVDFEVESPLTRIDFKGDEAVTWATGEVDRFPYSKWFTARMFISTLPVTFLFTGLCVSIFIGTEIYKRSTASTVSRFLGGLLAGCTISVLNLFYNFLARWFTNLENHKTDASFESSLITKTFLFRFVNSYISLFAAAFYDRSIETLFYQLFSVLISKHIVDIMCDVYFPYLIFRWKKRRFYSKLKRLKSPRLVVDRSGANVKIERWNLDQVELTFRMESFNGLVDDYSEGLIQFGFLTMFASAFPLAPLIAFVENLVVIRLNVWSYVSFVRRNEEATVAGIGPWLPIWEFMSIFAVVVNFSVMFWASSQLNEFAADFTTRLWLVIIAEHALVVCKMIAKSAIADVPLWVSARIASDHGSRFSRTAGAATNGLDHRHARSSNHGLTSEPHVESMRSQLDIDSTTDSQLNNLPGSAEMSSRVAFVLRDRDILLRRVVNVCRVEAEPLVLCVQCESARAVVDCVQCRDHYCNVCFSSVHKAGSRFRHTPSPMLQATTHTTHQQAPQWVKFENFNFQLDVGSAGYNRLRSYYVALKRFYRFPGAKSMIALDGLSAKHQFNSEEELWMNRVVRCLFTNGSHESIRDGPNYDSTTSELGSDDAQFGSFVNQLRSIQTGTLETRLRIFFQLADVDGKGFSDRLETVACLRASYMQDIRRIMDVETAVAGIYANDTQITVEAFVQRVLADSHVNRLFMCFLQFNAESSAGTS